MPPLASKAEQIEEMLGMLEKSMAKVFEKIAGGSKVDFSDPCAF
jgi:predicted dienelactone hydrolase